MSAEPLAHAAPPQRRTRRALLVLVVVLAVVAGLAGGWGLAHQFESPEQRVADAKPPAAKALWYPVKRGKLMDQASGRGTIKPLSTAALAPRELPANAVVTSQRVARGDYVNEMTAFAEVNGEPIFATSGDFSYYRDLEAKMTGPDVEQLQHSLLVAGFYIPADEFGTYGKETTAAVRDAYENRGYQPTEVLPLTSLAVVPKLPGRVVSASTIGQELELGTAVVTLGSGDAVAEAEVAAGAASRMKPGMHAGIFARGKLIADGTVHRVIQADGATRVQVAPERPISESEARRGIVIIVDILAIARRALLVPVRSIRTDGGQYGAVIVRHADGSTGRVEVRTLGELAGVAAIAPASSTESIGASDEVKVG